LGVDLKKVLLYESLLTKGEKLDPNQPETVSLKIHKGVFVGSLLQNNWISSSLHLTRYQNISAIICNILRDVFQSSIFLFEFYF